MFKSVVFFCFFFVPAFAAAKEWKWLAFGDMRGHIEPCGCDPKTDLGGIGRLGSFVEASLAQHPDLVILNLGHNFSSDPHKKLQNAFIAKAVKAIHPKASLFNERDPEHMALLKDQGSYVLSNGSESFYKNYPFVKQNVSAGDQTIFGFVSEKDSGLYLAADKKLLDAFKSHKASSKVLLFSGTQKDLELLMQANIFERIFLSNNAPSETYPGTQEKNNPSLLVLDQKTLMVPLGGMGVLRSPSLAAQSLPSLNELVPNRKASSLPVFSSQLPASDEGFLADLDKKDGVVVWLDHTYDKNNGVFAQILSDYHLHAKNFYAKMAEEKEKDLISTAFAGSKSCKLCHLKAYDTWKSTNHAGAFETLEKKGKDQIPECVGCHVLGFSEKGGFLSKEKTPDFKGVQCENCHGPRKDHVLRPQKSPHALDPKKACQSCHHNPHSPDFRFETYWPKIAH